MRRQARRLAKASGQALGIMLTGRSLSLALQIGLGRYLGAAGFGLFVLMVVIVRLAQRFALLGTNQAIVRFGAVYAAEGEGGAMRKIVAAAVFIVLLISIALAGGVTVFSRQLSGFLGETPALAEILRVGVWSVPFAAVVALASGVERSQQRGPRAAAIRELLVPVARVLVLGAVAVGGGGLIALTWGHVAALATAGLLSAVVLGAAWARTSAWTGAQASSGPLLPASVGRLLSTSFPLFLSTAALVAIMYFDRLMIAHFLEDASKVGLYHAAATLAIQVNVILAAFNLLAGPMIADAHAKADISLIGHLLQRSAWWAFVLTAPIVVVVAFNASLVMRMFGAEFGAAGDVLLLLVAAQAFNVGTGPVGLALQMTGFQRADLCLNLGLVVANIGLNIVLIPRFGILGAASATLVSLVLVHTIRLLLVNRLLGIWAVTRALLVLASLVGVVLAIGFYLTSSHILSAFGPFISLGVILLGMWYVVRIGADDFDRQLIATARDRLSAKVVGRQRRG